MNETREYIAGLRRAHEIVADEHRKLISELQAIKARRFVFRGRKLREIEARSEALYAASTAIAREALAG